MSDQATDATKQCPFCAETIKAAAVVCRFCNRDLTAPAAPELVARTCSHCGAAAVGNMRTCVSCGKPLVADIPAAPVAQPTPDAPAPKRQPIWAYIAITIIFIYGCYALFLGPAMQQASRTAYQAQTYRVTYRVSGSARLVDLTYENVDGGTEQKDNERTPWDVTFAGHGGQFLYVSAQNQDSSGSVKCEILLNGTVVKSAESSGAYTIASCSGSI